MGFTDEELRARMMAEAEAAIDAVLAKRQPAEAITLSEIEELALTVREQIGAKVAQVLVEASAKRQPVPGPTCPQCGEEMRDKGKKRKRVMTVVGEVRVERDYFHCPTCKVGLFPLDARWRLNASGYSDTRSQQMVWLSGLLPYTQVVEVLARIGRQHVPGTSVWERTQAHGERMRRHVVHQREQVAPERVVLPGPGQDHAQVKGVSLDGGMVHIRGEGWKEFKVGAVFDVVMRPDNCQ